MRKFYAYKSIGLITMLVIVVAVLFFWKRSKNDTVSTMPRSDQKQTIKTTVPISIRTEDIKEENFSGTTAVISGSSALATAARAYVESEIAQFRTSANEEVPDIRSEFGSDNPMANYTIDISAKYTWGSKTESIIINEYAYTGGANGHSLYTVMTSIAGGGTLLSLSDVIARDKRSAFVGLIKKELIAWRPEESEEPVVFEDEVKNLTFDSFVDWSLDDQNLVLYFDKYEVGPGVLGAVAFPISRGKIKSFLNPNF
jgi:hypothetical protein